MIREGKKAEFTYCRQGRTLAPIAGLTKSPFPGNVRNGEQSAQTVKEAVVITAAPLKHEEPASLQQVPAGRSFVREAKVHQAGTAASMQDVSSAQRVSCKNIECSSVQNDITINKLFHI
ncbi:MAG: hypothetical protein HFH72_01260 [Lachnospiraceae bacterium]|nr:hypothetical protein [Lachnospiraceae bacterium]